MDKIALEEMSLDQKEKEAVNFTKEVIQKYNLPYYVSFSGGKDSLVMIHIARRVDPDVKIIFNDTTIEFPGLIEYIYTLIHKGWNIEIINPAVTFKEGLKTFGPPGRRRRWCCDVIKKAPLWRKNRSFGSQGVISFLGIRAEESAGRSRYARISSPPPRGPVSPQKTYASQVFPLLYFSAGDIWSYIKKYNLPYCRLYDSGVARLGCMFCPFSSPTSDRLLVNLYPEKKKEWDDYLRDYAMDNGLDESWCGGAWRNHYGIRKYAIAGTKEVVGLRTIRYRLREPLSFRQKTLFIPFKKDPNIKIKFFPSDKTVLVRQPKWESHNTLLRVETQILKALNCINCGWCLIQCPHIEMEDNKIYIKDSCVGCLKCVYKTNCAVFRWGGNMNTLRNLGVARWGRFKKEIY